MTALETAQRLGLSEAAVAAFTGSPQEFAQHFGVDDSEAPGGGGGPVPTGIVNGRLLITSANDWTVMWDPAPADENVTDVQLRYTVVGGQVKEVIAPAADGSYVGTDSLGLPGATVQIYAKTINSNGMSVSSGLTGRVPNPPQAPTAVAASVTGVGAVTVTFTKGAAPVTGIQVTSTPPIALTYSNTDTDGSVGVTGTFAQGVAYTFRVIAANDDGTSVPSAPSASVTPNP
jgi:hypothetical protein